VCYFEGEHKIKKLALYFGKFINRCLRITLGITFVKSSSLTHRTISRKLFKNAFLRESECRTYFYLDPMPHDTELRIFYQTKYGNKINRKSIIGLRDLQHFEILKEYAPDYLSKDLVFLNFGSNLGGVSHLIRSCGLNVINIDVIKVPNFYENKWESFESILKVKDESVDIVYGSHSLEHVTDINEFKLQVKRILKPTG